ncbi:uncharacterized protein AB675_5202 [Cyphellophora attinorum]|uniref:Heterokaryon incompatibility domain-containing protein n=1 Tax=Cyphellophora attinorum TaxID=1664694 RepID=A0A0N1HSY1_9EURO|nr:uncharacterized protein AB675_5202 [Phialophora attinorum]KPI39474.1 hypothetical protein AB675_5202 [Phialophora attinorum]
MRRTTASVVEAECTTSTCSPSPSCLVSHTRLPAARKGTVNGQKAIGDDDRPAKPCPYVALSYTWGEPHDLDSIVVDGYAHVVQKNLKQALLALRSTDVVQAGCRVWADALCIDQNNAAEVNREIARMRHIYKEAITVVVWLGEEADQSDVAMDFIDNVSDKWESGSDVFEEWLRQELNTNGLVIWPALTSLMTRAYWSRLWVIQEITLGGPTAAILCGNKSTTLERYFLVYDAFHIFKATHRNPELAACVSQVLTTVDRDVYVGYRNIFHWQWEPCDDFQSLQDGEAGLGQAKRLKRLMTRCRKATCREPLDKVYGILGLLDEETSAQIVPDYGLPVRQVYMSFATEWIRAERDLNLLVQCGETGEQAKGPAVDIENLPSWCPNLLKEIKPQLNNFDPEFNSHGGMRTSRIAFTGADGSVLSTEGVLFDTLQGLSGVRYWDDDFRIRRPDFENAKSPANAYGPTFEDLRTALWKALVGGRDRHAQKAASYHDCILDSAILDDKHAAPFEPKGDTDDSLRWNLHLWLKRNQSFQVAGIPLKDFFQDLGVMESNPRLYYQCTGRVINWLWCRRLATTRKGYIAVVPRVSRVGDVVAILPGCTCTMLLRPSLAGDSGPKRFEIVAECYVQGMMDGEVVQMLEQGSCELEDTDIV